MEEEGRGWGAGAYVDGGRGRTWVGGVEGWVWRDGGDLLSVVRRPAAWWERQRGRAGSTGGGGGGRGALALLGCGPPTMTRAAAAPAAAAVADTAGGARGLRGARAGGERLWRWRPCEGCLPFALFSCCFHRFQGLHRGGGGGTGRGGGRPAGSGGWGGVTAAGKKKKSGVTPAQLAGMRASPCTQADAHAPAAPSLGRFASSAYPRGSPEPP